jgi:nucleoside-diphosphate-sugar epimerase
MLEKQKEGQEIKLFPNKPQRDFVYVKDIINANLFGLENYDDNKGQWYEVGSGESRTFEDVLDILKIEYSYYDEKDIPNGYQFFTQSDSSNWMYGWSPKYNLEEGLTNYLNFLSI